MGATSIWPDEGFSKPLGCLKVIQYFRKREMLPAWPEDYSREESFSPHQVATEFGDFKTDAAAPGFLMG